MDNDAVFLMSVFAFVLSMCTYIGYMFLREQKNSQQTKNLRPSVAPADVSAGRVGEVLGRVEQSQDRCVVANQQHLNDVRSRSCYPGLRGLHGFITFVAVAGCVVLWLVLMGVADDTAGRVYASLVCGVVIVGAILEYGLFTLIVDAVDVLIDNGRRESERK